MGLELKITDGANMILSRLEAAGFSAFVAGGAVRDLLMGKKPHDFDIATAATPRQVKTIFTHVIDTGIAHGTVTVIENKTGYEVTTYRTEKGYSDGRHPDQVLFEKEIEKDLSRRDFTVNAMAYSPWRGLIDCYGGQEDLTRKVIRCVGEPEKRFKEDALRMLRAVRFSAALDFEIDGKTQQAIRKCGVLLKRVSAERILEECNKILLSAHPDRIRMLHELGLLQYIIPQLEKCFGTPQRNKYHIYDVGEHTIQAVSHTPPDLVLRWAALLHDVGKPSCLSTDEEGIIHFYGHYRESVVIADDVLHRLRMEKDNIRDICILIENHDVRVEPSLPAVKRMMARTGEELFAKLLLLQRADNQAKNPDYLEEKLGRIDQVQHIYQEVLAEGQPYLVSHLVVNGRDLIKHGYKAGREIGDTLRILLDEVVINPALNNREYLLRRAGVLRQKRDRRRGPGSKE